MTKKEVEAIKKLEEKLWNEFDAARHNQYSTKEYITMCANQWDGVWQVMKKLHMIEERR